MRAKLVLAGAVAVLGTAGIVLPAAAMAGPTPAFSNTPLISTVPATGITTAPNANSTGNSEPAITFGNDGTMAVDGLA
ncbi:MAG TPA: hypothetical protein VFB50_15610, partial [Chloroflexota bacterium]|nr:hypothetical protein [Chloroflexota bacterium]